MTTTVSQRVGDRRLLKLAAFLRTVPRKRFDYSTWVGESWRGAQNLSCGTTACALGWAATMPTFRRLGLRLDSYGTPRLNSMYGAFTSAEVLFAIDAASSEYLFSPSLMRESRATAKQVARKIERFVADRSA